jgi:hypothetical protein
MNAVVFGKLAASESLHRRQDGCRSGFQSSDELIDPRPLARRKRRRSGWLRGAGIVSIVVIAGIGRIRLRAVVTRLHGGRRSNTRNTHHLGSQIDRARLWRGKTKGR